MRKDYDWRAEIAQLAHAGAADLRRSRRHLDAAHRRVLRALRRRRERPRLGRQPKFSAPVSPSSPATPTTISAGTGRRARDRSLPRPNPPHRPRSSRRRGPRAQSGFADGEDPNGTTDPLGRSRRHNGGYGHRDAERHVPRTGVGHAGSWPLQRNYRGCCHPPYPAACASAARLRRHPSRTGSTGGGQLAGERRGPRAGHRPGSFLVLSPNLSAPVQSPGAMAVLILAEWSEVLPARTERRPGYRRSQRRLRPIDCRPSRRPDRAHAPHVTTEGRDTSAAGLSTLVSR